MQVKIQAQITLSEAEYFSATDKHAKTGIQVQNLHADPNLKWVYCFGPKILSNGKPSGARRSCVLADISEVPQEVAALIRGVLAPFAASVPGVIGAESARQAALG
jgi:hypothetical protein